MRPQKEGIFSKGLDIRIAARRLRSKGREIQIYEKVGDAAKKVSFSSVARGRNAQKGNHPPHLDECNYIHIRQDVSVDPGFINIANMTREF